MTFEPFLATFNLLTVFGPFCSQKRVKMVPKWAKKGSKTGHLWVILDHFWVDPRSLWGHLGIILASFWAHFGVVLVSS